ncbi:hypothetical protein MHYP_G00160720 [Metynnis hypsauchen]
MNPSFEPEMPLERAGEPLTHNQQRAWTGSSTAHPVLLVQIHLEPVACETTSGLTAGKSIISGGDSGSNYVGDWLWCNNPPPRCVGWSPLVGVVTKLHVFRAAAGEEPDDPLSPQNPHRLCREFLCTRLEGKHSRPHVCQRDAGV